jgi:hypothetical protein
MAACEAPYYDQRPTRLPEARRECLLRHVLAAPDVLVAKCSRAELEQLIITSIRSHEEAVALGDVEAAIEAAAAARLPVQPKAPVCR